MSDAAANEKLEQYRKMAESDPNNELGHFSLGRTLLEAGQPAEAAKSFQRVIALNPNIAKAYQLLADAQLATGHRDYAIQTLTEGMKVAHQRGELMPKTAMGDKLKELDAPVPEFESQAKPQAIGEGQVFCKRHAGPGPKLEKPPMRNAFGQEIYDNICANCWKEAIGFGTKVINELRLPLADPQAQKMWDQHVREFLNLNK
ncbi:MAG: Fe(2+)-trafficking protein [Tepidisphaeraceae bacterium]